MCAPDRPEPGVTSGAVRCLVVVGDDCIRLVLPLGRQDLLAQHRGQHASVRAIESLHDALALAPALITVHVLVVARVRVESVAWVWIDEGVDQISVAVFLS